MADAGRGGHLVTDVPKGIILKQRKEKPELPKEAIAVSEGPPRMAMPTLKELCSKIEALLVNMHPDALKISEMGEVAKRVFGGEVDPEKLYAKSWEELAQTIFKDRMALGAEGTILLSDKAQRAHGFLPPLPEVPAVAAPRGRVFTVDRNGVIIFQTVVPTFRESALVATPKDVTIAYRRNQASRISSGIGKNSPVDLASVFDDPKFLAPPVNLNTADDDMQLPPMQGPEAIGIQQGQEMMAEIKGPLDQPPPFAIEFPIGEIPHLNNDAGVEDEKEISQEVEAEVDHPDQPNNVVQKNSSGEGFAIMKMVASRRSGFGVKTAEQMAAAGDMQILAQEE